MWESRAGFGRLSQVVVGILFFRISAPRHFPQAFLFASFFFVPPFSVQAWWKKFVRQDRLQTAISLQSQPNRFFASRRGFDSESVTADLVVAGMMDFLLWRCRLSVNRMLSQSNS